MPKDHHDTIAEKNGFTAEELEAARISGERHATNRARMDGIAAGAIFHAWNHSPTRPPRRRHKQRR